MTLVPTRLLGAGLSAALAVGSLLAAPPAHAAPGFIDVRISRNVDSYVYVGACNAIATPTPPSSVPVAENGAPVTSTLVATTSYYRNADFSDTISATGAVTMTTRATSSAGLPQSVSASYSGTFSSAASMSTSGCWMHHTTSLQTEFEFTTTQPLWVTLTKSNRGALYTEAYVESDDTPLEFGLWNEHVDGTSTTTVYLPPGHYGGTLTGQSRGSARTTAAPVSGSGTASITFAPVGSASEAPSGKASKYVALPASRTCATHNATATLTTKKKLIKQIAKVTFTVNGKKAATLKGKKVKKGKAVVLPLADNAAADISATVVLENGKKRTVDASYLACTS